MPTPETVISAVYSRVDRELARQEAKSGDYEGFLQMTKQYASLAHTAYLRAWMAREKADRVTKEALEKQAYMTAVQAAISALMALGHFPYLDHIEEEIPGRPE